jgi:hypothetical protein
MIEIGGFVFLEFLPTPKNAEEGVNWLHFGPMGGMIPSANDRRRFRAIVEHNRAESDLVQYIKTGGVGDFGLSGSIPTNRKGGMPKGIILALKGGTEKQALKYCKQIAEKMNKKQVNPRHK